MQREAFHIPCAEYLIKQQTKQEEQREEQQRKLREKDMRRQEITAKMERIFQAAQQKRDVVFQSNEAEIEAKSLQETERRKKKAEETWASIDRQNSFLSTAACHTRFMRGSTSSREGCQVQTFTSFRLPEAVSLIRQGRGKPEMRLIDPDRCSKRFLTSRSRQEQLVERQAAKHAQKDIDRAAARVLREELAASEAQEAYFPLLLLCKLSLQQKEDMIL